MACSNNSPLQKLLYSTITSISSKYLAFRATHFHGGQKKSRPKVCQGTDSSENFVVDFVEYQSSEDVDEDSPDGHWKQMDGDFEGREAENVLHEQR